LFPFIGHIGIGDIDGIVHDVVMDGMEKPLKVRKDPFGFDQT